MLGGAPYSQSPDASSRDFILALLPQSTAKPPELRLFLWGRNNGFELFPKTVLRVDQEWHGASIDCGKSSELTKIHG